MKKIKKEDIVIVCSGRDKGKVGKVLKVIDKENVLVEGVNLKKKHEKVTEKNPNKGVRIMEAKINVSNVAILDPDKNRATKISFIFLNGEKKRYCKLSKKILP